MSSLDFEGVVEKISSLSHDLCRRLSEVGPPEYFDSLTFVFWVYFSVIDVSFRCKTDNCTAAERERSSRQPIESFRGKAEESGGCDCRTLTRLSPFVAVVFRYSFFLSYNKKSDAAIRR